MDEKELAQCIDFMDIGLTELEHGNDETAQGFFEDVNKMLQEEYNDSQE